MKKLSIILVVSALIAALTIVGCTQKSVTPTPEVPKTLKVGLCVPLSGPVADWGIPVKQGLELRIEQINNAGGVKIGQDTYNIELIAEDNLFTSDGAKTAAEKLIYRDHVNVICGGIASHDTLGVQLVTTPAKIINCSMAWTSEALKPEGQPTVPYAFKSLPTPHETIRGIWGYIQQAYPQAKKVALLDANDMSSRYGEALNAKWLKYIGLQVVSEEYYEYGTKDFVPILTKVLSQNPDVIHSGSAGMSELGTFIKQSRQMGYKGLFMQEIPITGELLFQTSGQEAANGLVTYDFLCYGPKTTSEYQDFAKAFKEKYGYWISAVSAQPAFIDCFVQAVEKAGGISDTDKIVGILETGTFKSFGVDMRFAGADYYGRPRMLSQPLLISEIKGGEQVPVGNITVDEQLTPWPIE
ncbi:MAG: ABC transporter substrate-binding protein [Dehalococcoidia bacterium]|nr:ABC transporter substrate-binding protein [Dehalococcoidia bacterium]